LRSVSKHRFYADGQTTAALTSRPNFRLSHIAVLTNLSETEVDARGGLPAGVLYMSKPINFDELRGYLRGCCAAKTRLYAK